MQVIKSSLFRALCAFVVGALLVQYREETVRWITISIGILFFISGIISCVSYFSMKKTIDDAVVYDSQGNQLTGLRPSFPIVGIGSLLLGAILAMMPATFLTGLVYVLATLLILGAIGQFVNLSLASRYLHIGLVWWLGPSLLLLVGIIAIVNPKAIITAPLFVIGWAMMLYGVIECVNTLKIYKANKIREQHNAAKATQIESQTPEPVVEEEEEKEEEQPPVY